ncbi:OmpH family outer membrane protein [Marinilabiliaceae bacterium ANBcel2]|nr:OmpH family outer membrane protein [Marinilabiliaceae bacterium ANBcel2]
MRIAKLSFFILAVSLISLSTKAQDSKFGHVNIADIVLLMPEYQNINTVMEEETQRLERQLMNMQEELQRIEQEYESNFDTYTEEERAAKEEEYTTVQQRVQQFYSNAQQTLQQKQQELQMPVLEKLQRAIAQVGDEHGYLYIFEENSGLTPYKSQNSEDVTTLVKEKLGL